MIRTFEELFEKLKADGAFFVTNISIKQIA